MTTPQYLQLGRSTALISVIFQEIWEKKQRTASEALNSNKDSTQSAKTA